MATPIFKDLSMFWRLSGQPWRGPPVSRPHVLLTPWCAPPSRMRGWLLLSEHASNYLSWLVLKFETQAVANEKKYRIISTNHDGSEARGIHFKSVSTKISQCEGCSYDYIWGIGRFYENFAKSSAFFFVITAFCLLWSSARHTTETELTGNQRITARHSPGRLRWRIR